jgi:hypothetical protein
MLRRRVSASFTVGPPLRVHVQFFVSKVMKEKEKEKEKEEEVVLKVTVNRIKKLKTLSAQ